MEASSQELKSDLSFEEGKEQSQHAAEQLVLQTVKHFEARGGIQNHNISKETGIDKELVDKVLKELVRRREVMLSRSGINIFYLPFKMPSPISRDKKIEVPASAAMTEPATPGSAPAAAVIPEIKERTYVKAKPSELKGYCPICGTLHTSTQAPKNLIAQLTVHMVRMHKVTKEEARKRLAEAGEIKDRGRTPHPRPAKVGSPKKTSKVVAREPILPFRDAVAMGEPMAPSFPADRHDDTGLFEEDPSAEISAQVLQQIIPRGMNGERPIPASFYTKRDILEINKQICREAGIPLRFVYSSTETDKTPVNERLSMDLEG